MRYLILIATLSLLLSNCAHYEPMEVHQTDDIPQGPGAFSGEEGEFVIFRR